LERPQSSEWKIEESAHVPRCSCFAAGKCDVCKASWNLPGEYLHLLSSAWESPAPKSLYVRWKEWLQALQHSPAESLARTWVNGLIFRGLVGATSMGLLGFQTGFRLGYESVELKVRGEWGRALRAPSLWPVDASVLHARAVQLRANGCGRGQGHRLGSLSDGNACAGLVTSPLHLALVGSFLPVFPLGQVRAAASARD
jgi:hypothetical protein